MAERKPFGRINGVEVQLAVLTNGKYKASIATYGATLVYYGTDSYNAVLSHDSAEKYAKDNNFMGMVVGPYANRIEGASFVLDGKEYRLEKNDNDNNLHSGSATYAHKIWRITGQSNTAVTLSLSTPEEGGFPGKHDTEITYILSEDGILTLSYKATSTEKCPCALTNHAYFILDDGGARGT
ncbi:MAG: hypothetical protein KBS81_08990, partial [Spirochaetales bacterium]|nr:hypothetical protein [Candidatus Physcosoma equi]